MKKQDYDKKYYLDHKKDLKLKAKKSHLKRNYNLTLEQKKQLIEQQEYKCAICLATITMNSPIDHIHGTKIVRGILCTQCNLMLGYAKDNPSVLRAASIYLQRTFREKVCKI